MGGQAVRSYDFIPGSVLRGALGTVIASGECAYHPIPADHDGCEKRSECLYYRLNGPERASPQVQFHNAYKLCEHGGRSLPIPIYWRICKICRAPRNFLADYAEHGFPSRRQRCEDGGEEAYEDPRGFWCFHGDRPQRVQVEFRRITRTAIDPSTLAAGEGRLHSFDAIREGQIFKTHISIFPGGGEAALERDEVRKIADYARALEEEGIGKGKTRGFGEVSIRDVSIREISDREIRADAERIQKDMEKSGEKYGSPKFVLNLSSPLILKETGQKRLKSETLAAYMRRAHQIISRPSKTWTPEIEIELIQAKVAAQCGWSLKKNERKPLVSGYDMGSSIFVRAKPDEYLPISLVALGLYNSGRYKSYGNGEMSVEVVV